MLIFVERGDIILLEVLIDMNNNNSLIALAYIKSNDNPLEVFCNYILYALTKSPNKCLRVDELKEKVLEYFGLLMPQQMITVCTRILNKNKKIKYLDNGAGYCATHEEDIVKTFDSNFCKLAEQEKYLINELRVFVKTTYGQDWDYENTKLHLSYFLNEQGNASNIFLDENLDSYNKISPSWYIGRYVETLMENKHSIEYKYLNDLINGFMILHGIYQINDYEQDRNQKFKGTKFYFDTKLILRAMGYSWNSNVQGTQELISLITKEYGGKIAVFDKTINEVVNALNTAGEAYKSGNTILDSEMRTYALLNPSGAELLCESAMNVRTQLKKQGFEFEDNIDWNDESNQKYCIDESGLKAFIQNLYPTWREGTINNDVNIINQINILRKGNYSCTYGGKTKLPVMITSNSGLVYAVRDYAKKQYEQDNKTSWNPHALPIISDNMILFRLWVPVAHKHKNLPTITMARYAHSAQNADSVFFESLKQKAIEYKKVNNVDILSLSDIRRKKLEDIIVEKTCGDPDKITQPIMASSVDELIRIENFSLQEDLNKSQKEVQSKNETIKSKDNQIIELASSQFINKLRLSRLLIYLAKYWWIISAIILIIGSSLIATTNLNNFKGWLLICVAISPVLIEIILFVLGCLLSNDNIKDFFLQKAIQICILRYAKRIKKKIRESEKTYTKDIILECLHKTPLLSKHEKYWPKIDRLL